MFKNHNLEYYPAEKVLNPPVHVKEEIEILLARLRKINKSGNIVEFGAGTGRLTIPLLKNNYAVTAVEIDKESSKELTQSAKKIKRLKKLRLVNSLPKQKFETIVGADVLHHLDLNNFLTLFFQHLNKEGTILFSEPNPWNILWWFFIFLFLDWRQEKGLIYCSYLGMDKRLKKVGFRSVRISGFALFPPQLFVKSKVLTDLNYFLGDLPFLKLFAYRLFFEAEK